MLPWNFSSKDFTFSNGSQQVTASWEGEEMELASENEWKKPRVAGKAALSSWHVSKKEIQKMKRKSSAF